MAKNIIWSGKHDLISRKALALKSIVVDGRRMIPYLDLIDAPTVDAVEVVRCKDCIHSFMTINGERAKYCDMFDSDDGVYFDKNHFCGYGERGSDETD